MRRVWGGTSGELDGGLFAGAPMITPYYQHGGITIFHAPYADALPEIDGDYMIVTDPSYGTGGWRRTASGMGSNPAGTLVVEPWDDGSLEWLRLVRTDVVATFWPSCHARHLLPTAYDLGLTKQRTLSNNPSRERSSGAVGR